MEIKGESIEEVKEFSYLEKTMTTDGRMKKEMTIRITKAMNAYGRLYNTLWKIPHISLIKMRIYRASIIPILTYGTETWIPLKEDIDRLEVCQMRCIRSILGVSRRQRITNDDLHNVRNYT